MTRSVPRTLFIALAVLAAVEVISQFDRDNLYSGEELGRWPPVFSSKHARQHVLGPSVDEPDDPWVDEREITETTVVLHAPGWTVFNNLYLLNHTFYIVSSNDSALPEVRMMVSTGANVGFSHEEQAAMEPTDNDMRLITPDKAHELFTGRSTVTGLPTYPIREAGLSWIVNDAPQYITHYYHFAAELLPRRMIYTKLGAGKWRDYSGMNALLMRGFLPRTLIETANDVQGDRTVSGRPYVFSRVVLADRGATTRGTQFPHTGRSASETFTLPATPHWFAPVRSRLLDFIGGISRVDRAPRPSERLLVTYVSRQKWGRRMLNPADHAALVETMTKAAAEDGFDFVEVDMDRVGLEEQVRLAARTTVMMGVHGNGLTHLLWMKPTSRATVLEFFTPGGFARDYSFTALALGIEHYGFWGEESFVAPHQPPTAYPESFQGNNIPISAEAVLRIVRMRINNDEEADD